MNPSSLVQGSQEWLEWRRSKVMASDLPIILGESKWSTPLELWKRKTGFLPEQEENPAMRRGKELEPHVLAIVNKGSSDPFMPIVVQHKDHPWAGASLDGMNMDGTVLEIKCPSLNDHRLAEDGKIPPHYWPQVQWQLFCAGSQKGLYVSYYRDDMIATVPFERDEDFINDSLFPKAYLFHQHVDAMLPPDETLPTAVYIADPQFEELARHYKAADEMYKWYEMQRKFYHDKLVAFTDDGDCYGSGLKIKRQSRSGQLDNKKFIEYLKKRDPSIETIDMAPFTKKEIGYWVITQYNDDDKESPNV